MNSQKINKIFGPKLGGYNFQDSGNYFMDNIIYFHDLVLCILFFISLLVSWFLITTLLYFGNPVLTVRLYNIYNEYSSIFLKYFDKFVFFLHNLSLGFTKRYPGYGRFIFRKRYINTRNVKAFLKFHKLTYRYYFYSDVKLEFLWTLFPSIVLFFLAIPSFGLLFSVEKVSAPELTVKVVGHQWYWEYQYMDYINFKEIVKTEKNTFLYLNKKEDEYIIESYMINDEDLETGQFRLLEVDKKLMLPINTSIRLLITSDDVLHSWAVPSLGIKVDACPGRINEVIIKIRDLGIYYGQCSELCGWYHGFMPIVIQSLEVNDYKVWALSSFLDIKYIENESN